MVATAKTKNLSLKFQKLIPPINFPLLLSLACHGLFFLAIFPKLQLNSNGMSDSDRMSSTSVVELNAIEQTRLPDLTPQQFFSWDGMINSLPDGNNQMPNSQLPNIPLPDGNFNSFQFPLIDNSNSAIVNLPPPPSLPPSFDDAPIYLPQYSFNDSIPQPANQLPPPPPLDANAMADLPPNMSMDSPENVIDIEAQDNQAEIRQNLFPVETTEEDLSPRQWINRNNQQIAENANSNTLANYPTGENSQPQESTIAMTSPPITAKNYQELGESLQAENQSTSNEEARKNYVSWAAQETKTGKPKEMTITGIYPRDACIRRLEGEATYGVTVNPQGRVTNTQLIKSSGYPLFNNQAFRQIQGMGFNNTGIPEAYHVRVNFKYNPNICPSLSLSNVGKFEPQKPSANTVNPPSTNITKPEKTEPTKIINPRPTNPEIPVKPVNTPSNEQPITPPPQSIPVPVIQEKNQPPTTSNSPNPQPIPNPELIESRETPPPLPPVKPVKPEVNPPVENQGNPVFPPSQE